MHGILDIILHGREALVIQTGAMKRNIILSRSKSKRSGHIKTEGDESHQEKTLKDKPPTSYEKQPRYHNTTLCNQKGFSYVLPKYGRADVYQHGEEKH